MDRIVWDDAAAQRAIRQLQEAARLLEACGEDLRADCAAGEALFKENTGTSRRIMDQAESMLRRTEELRDRTQQLTRAVTRAAEIMEAAEVSLRGTMEALPTGTSAESILPSTESLSGEVTPCPPAPVIYVPPFRSVYPVTAPWLIQAADAMLGT